MPRKADRRAVGESTGGVVSLVSVWRLLRGFFVTSIFLVHSNSVGGQAQPQPECPAGALPAYSHNDYENTHPLTDALRLGFRGIEVDIFLVDGALRVGHDVQSARRGGSLETLYLEPLRRIVARCGWLTGDGSSWLLAVELKEASARAYAEFLQMLTRYAELFSPSRNSASSAPVEVVLVGWHPAPSQLHAESDGLIRIQHRITAPEGVTAPIAAAWVRLISIDYGKTIGRAYSSVPQRNRWFAGLREVKRALPGRLLRVHNVPVDGKVYGALLDAGVDLIGTKELAATQRLLDERGSR